MFRRQLTTSVNPIRIFEVGSMFPKAYTFDQYYKFQT